MSHTSMPDKRPASEAHRPEHAHAMLPNALSHPFCHPRADCRAHTLGAAGPACGRPLAGGLQPDACV
jgi:hypothetical protein